MLQLVAVRGVIVIVGARGPLELNPGVIMYKNVSVLGLLSLLS